MNYRHCCVIDKEKKHKEFVLVVNGEIQHYVLQDGERLIDASFPAGFVLPEWDGGDWQETATEDEIAAAKATAPAVCA